MDFPLVLSITPLISCNLEGHKIPGDLRSLYRIQKDTATLSM